MNLSIRTRTLALKPYSDGLSKEVVSSTCAELHFLLFKYPVASCAYQISVNLSIFFISTTVVPKGLFSRTTTIKEFDAVRKSQVKRNTETFVAIRCGHHYSSQTKNAIVIPMMVFFTLSNLSPKVSSTCRRNDLQFRSLSISPKKQATPTGTEWH